MYEVFSRYRRRMLSLTHNAAQRVRQHVSDVKAL